MFGEKETCTVHIALGASEAGQPLAAPKPLVVEGAPKGTAVPPVFCTETVSDADVPTTTGELNCTGLGVNVSAPAVTPVPASVATAVPPAVPVSCQERETLPGFCPGGWVGLKLTWKVQLAWAASEPPQVELTL